MADIQKQVKKTADDLMNREVNRAEFLRYTGVALLSVMGINSFFKNLNSAVPKHGKEKLAKSGYGRGSYGG